MSYGQQIAIYGFETHFILPTSHLIQCDFYFGVLIMATQVSFGSFSKS